MGPMQFSLVPRCTQHSTFAARTTRILCVGALFLLATLAVGCGEQSTSDDTSAPASSSVTTITQAHSSSHRGSSRGHRGHGNHHNRGRKYKRALIADVRTLAADHNVAPVSPAPHVRQELVDLGQALMFDKELSGNRNMSCMSCHDASTHLDDDRSMSLGEGGLGLGAERIGGPIHSRNSLALFNLHELEFFFWDGRLRRLPNGVLLNPADEELTPDMEAVFEFGPLSALGMFPVENVTEMRGIPGSNEVADAENFTDTWAALMARLGNIPQYRTMFEAAYPGTQFDDMTFAHASNAMAGFMLATFEARQSPWQKFLRGDDNAMSLQQLRGAKSFFEDGCGECHTGTALSDMKFHNTGLAQFGPGREHGIDDTDDFGAGDFPEHNAANYSFRTAPLFNVALTGPWGHIGQFNDLREFVAHYDDPAAKLFAYDISANIDPTEYYLADMDIENRHLIAAGIEPMSDVTVRDLDAVVAFLEAQTDPDSLDLSHINPTSVPSGLSLSDGVPPVVPGRAHGSVKFTDIADDNPNSGIGNYERVPSARQAVADYWLNRSLTTPMNFVDIFNTPLRPRGTPGTIIFDYDNDGDEDVFVTNGPGAPNSLFTNQLAQTGEARFIDRAIAAGVDTTATDSNGACFGDIDNDGDYDLFVVADNGPSHFFRNEGNGTFTDISALSQATPSGIGGTSCAFGDIDGDGLLDLSVARGWHQEDVHACFTSPFGAGIQHNELYTNNGDYTFTDVSDTSGIRNLGGLPPWAQGAPAITWQVTMVDYDMDGDLDIFNADDQCALPNSKFGGIDRGFLQIWDNDGNGNFTNRTVDAGMNIPSPWMGLSFADFNSDGYLDVFSTSFGDWGKPFVGVPIAVGDETSRWFLGTPDKKYTDVGVGDLGRMPFGWGTTARDFDNDGDTDISFHGGMDMWFMIDSSNPGTMLLNDGNANFGLDLDAFDTHHSRRNNAGSAAGDINNDGFADIITVSNFNFRATHPLVQYGGANAAVNYFTVFDSTAYLTPVFDQDIPDQYVWNGTTFDNGTITVELNSADNGNNWARVRLMGTIGITTDGRVNRDGIGAIVSFTPKHGKTVMEPILGGASHMSQDSLTRTFGMERANKGTVDVLWPGGVRNRYDFVRDGDNLVLPEIPCSYDTTDSRHTYEACVDDALAELKAAGVIDNHMKNKLRQSARRAYRDEH